MPCQSSRSISRTSCPMRLISAPWISAAAIIRLSASPCPSFRPDSNQAWRKIRGSRQSGTTSGTRGGIARRVEVEVSAKLVRAIRSCDRPETGREFNGPSVNHADLQTIDFRLIMFLMLNYINALVAIGRRQSTFFSMLSQPTARIVRKCQNKSASACNLLPGDRGALGSATGIQCVGWML